MTTSQIIGTILICLTFASIAYLLWEGRNSPCHDFYCPKCDCYWGLNQCGVVSYVVADRDRELYTPTICPRCQRREDNQQ